MNYRQITVAACVLGLGAWAGLVRPSQEPRASAQPPRKTVHLTIDAGQDAKPLSRFIYATNRPLDGAYAGLTLTRLSGKDRKKGSG
jgi:hypothetical protein